MLDGIYAVLGCCFMNILCVLVWVFCFELGLKWVLDLNFCRVLRVPGLKFVYICKYRFLVCILIFYFGSKCF